LELRARQGAAASSIAFRKEAAFALGKTPLPKLLGLLFSGVSVMTEILPDTQLIELTADIVAAYVSNNPVPASDLPGLIDQIHIAISNLRVPSVPLEEPLTPRMPIKKTITPDYLISLEDGKQYKTLKRHLTIHGLTPDEYRAKWGLPRDYPMVAASYSAHRSKMAKSLGLGRKPSAKKPVKRIAGKAKA
jgi:predicted transcriptional regulator